MLIIDEQFVLADIERARSELEAAIHRCNHILAQDPKVAVDRALIPSVQSAGESALRGIQYLKSAVMKRGEMLKQRQAA